MDANSTNFVNNKISSADKDQEYLEQYQCKISDYQRRNLLPLQEDLADWINKSLGKHL